MQKKSCVSNLTDPDSKDNKTYKEIIQNACTNDRTKGLRFVLTLRRSDPGCSVELAVEELAGLAIVAFVSDRCCSFRMTPDQPQHLSSVACSGWSYILFDFVVPKIKEFIRWFLEQVNVNVL